LAKESNPGLPIEKRMH